MGRRRAKSAAAVAAGLILIMLASLSWLYGPGFTVANINQLDHVATQPDSTIAVDPTNPSLMFQSESVGGLGLGVYSLDGGKTWHHPTDTPSLGINDDPSIGISPNGTYYDIEHTRPVMNSTFYSAYATNYLEYSRDRGKTWMLGPIPYASLVTNSSLNAVQTSWVLLNGTVTRSCDLPGYDAVGDYEKIAVDNNPGSPFAGNIYIIGNFAIAESNACWIHAGFIRSSNGGASWDLHVVTNPGPTDSQVEKLAIGPSGEIYFVRSNAPSGLDSILFEKSTDGGVSWSNQVISNQAQISGSITGNPSVAVSSTGQLSIVYESCLTVCNMTRNGASAVFLINSANDGADWSHYSTISDSNAMPYWSLIPRPPSSCNALVLCGPPRNEINVIYTSTGLSAAWRDWRNSPNSSMTDIYAYVPGLAASNIRITPRPGFICYPPNGNGANYCNDFGQSGGSFISMTSAAGKIYIAYGQDANGDTYPDSVLATITTSNSNPLIGLYNYVPWILGAGLVLVLVGISYQLRRVKSQRQGTVPSTDEPKQMTAPD